MARPILVSLAGLGLLWAPATLALPEYQEGIPSRPEACLTCHDDAGEGTLNPFGQDVGASFARAEVGFLVDWSAVFNIDSDMDGQTNGQELGDPCGEWTAGAAPRLSDWSNPGDNWSLTAYPEVGCSDDSRPFDNPDPRVFDPGVGGPVFLDGGSSGFGCLGLASQAGEARPGALSALLVVLAGWAARRRRGG